MENQRIFVWAALGLLLWLNYLAWQRDYAPPPAPAPVAATPPATNNQGASESLPELPSSNGAPAAPAATTSLPAAEAAAAAAPSIRVVTDVFDMQISTRGGELFRADLL